MLRQVSYSELNPRQQQAYNLQKISGVLADYGYLTIRLTSDGKGADFIAEHIDGVQCLKVQLKGRLTFDKKYLEHDLHVAFRDGDSWFLYPHNEVLKAVLETGIVANTRSWEEGGLYHFPSLSKSLRELLEPYRLQIPTKPITQSRQGDH